MNTAPAPITLAIADEGALLASISAADLIDALYIAAGQLAVKSDEEANDYGLDTAEDAHALRDRLLAAHAAVNGAM